MIVDLIVPSLAAGAAVFFVSAIIWMFVRWHDKDLKGLPDEQQFMDDLSARSLEPGLYMWPNCQGDHPHNSPEFKANWEKGPWGSINILGGKPNFPRNLIGSFLTNWAVSFAVAVSIAMTLGAVSGAEVAITCSVCQVLLPVAILSAVAYCLGGLGNDLFLGKPCRFICTSILDGLIYAGVTAVMLWWLWPASG